MINNTWSQESLKTKDILLDYENPRIDANENTTQKEIIILLLKTEKVCELAKSIIEIRGLLAGERIIVTQENGKYIVLEGNRRVCACQLILNPRLIPDDFKSRFPLNNDNILLSYLEKIDADVAPNRLSAEITITKRHTEPGIETWSPIAKQRRIARLLKSGRTFEELMSEFGMTKQNIITTLRDYYLIEYTKSLNQLKMWEKDILNDPKIKPNAYTRFFTLKGVKEKLGLDFNEKGELIINIKKNIFNKSLACIARELLIPDQTTGKTPSNTRTTPDEIFNNISKIDPSLSDYYKAAEKESVSEKETQRNEKISLVPSQKDQDQPVVSIFFENLTCTIKDDQLLTITKEISTINHNKFPLASTFLLRALIERTLNWCIEQYSLKTQLNKDFYIQNPGQKGKEPGLEFVLKFCIKNWNSIFNINRIQSVLSQWKTIKEFSDIIIHCKWILPHPKNLEYFASLVRPLIEQIFSKSVLK